MRRKDITVKCLTMFEDKIATLFEQKRIQVPIHLCGSTNRKYEKWLISLFKRVKEGDYLFSTHRNHYHYLLKTGNLEGLMKEILQVDGGICEGYGGSMHIIDREHNFFASGIVAGCVSIAVGVAWALKQKKSKAKVWCFVGDGATDSGWFFEALRYATNFDLPIVFVIEDNDRSVCTPNNGRWRWSFWRTPIGVLFSKIKYIAYKAKWPHTGVENWVTF